MKEKTKPNIKPNIKYIEYDSEGEIIRYGSCQYKTFHLIKPFSNGTIMQGIGMPDMCKVDLKTKKIVKKNTEEIEEYIEKNKPRNVIFEDKIANITNKQLQSILDRLETLENK